MWSSQWGCQLWPADLEPTRRSSDDEALDLWLPPYNEVYQVYEYFWGKDKRTIMHDWHTDTHLMPCRVCEGGHWLQCVLPSAQMGRETSRQNLSIRPKDQQPHASAHEQTTSQRQTPTDSCRQPHYSLVCVASQMSPGKNAHSGADAQLRISTWKTASA